MSSESNANYPSTVPGASMYYPQAPGPALARVETNFSTMTSESRCNLVDHEESNSRSRTRRYSLPLFQHPSVFNRTSNHRGGGGGADDGGGFEKGESPLEKLFKGWRILILGSWLNILFILIPVAWTLSITLSEYHGLVFIFCLLVLIPLVKMHEVTTRDLAIRIGGSKTGLLNASLSNTVEIVVAFSALRKCELRVVQSSLIGSILAKLLLVLGLCFFAGGMRFSEQGFDATANQVHSSLLSISVGVVLLPAAYHFALSGDKNDSMPLYQQRSILNMSHGVSIILMTIYALYLLFQLVSHTHLYKDLNKRSRRLSINVPVPLQPPTIFHTLTGMRDKGKILSPSPSSAGSDYDGEDNVSKWFKGVRKPDTPPSLSPSPSRSHSTSPVRQMPILPGTPYVSQPYGFSNTSEITLTNSAGGYPMAINSTVRLIQDGDTGVSSRAADPASIQGSRSASGSTAMTGSGRSFSGSTINSQYHPGLTLDTEGFQPEKYVDVPLDSSGSQSQMSPSSSTSSMKEPHLSWFLTGVALVFVTISVAFTADWLVEAMNGISMTISKEWVALILLPAVSAIAECGNAIGVSVQDQLTLSISVAVGSSIQTALFVIPFMVTVGWIMGKPLSLLFDPFESLVLYLSVQTMTHVVADGKSNWLEGAILIGLYIIIAVSFWFYPGSNLPSTLAACTS